MGMRLRYAILFFVFFCCLLDQVVGQQVGTLDAGNPLAVDTNVKHGKLDNGFSYYIRQNLFPEKVIMVYFVVKAGFLQESEEQVGLAHLLEHVAFKGTREFPKGVNYYFEKLGMIKGSQINATTGYDGTVYMLTVPSDSIGSLDLALSIVKGLTSELLMRPEDIEVERAAVVAEATRASGGLQRELEAIVPSLLDGSRLSKRGMGADNLKSIHEFSPRQLYRFYEDWYRPDLQSIIVVGPVDTNIIENKVRKIFKDIPARSGPRYENYEAYIPRKVNFLRVVDPEQYGITIKMYKRFPERKMKTIQDLRYSVNRDIYNLMMATRLEEIQKDRGYTSGFSYNSYNRRGVIGLPGIDIMETTVSVDSLFDFRERFIHTMRELYRVQLHGFTKEELEAAKRVLLRDQNLNSKESSMSIVQSCLEHFLYGSDILDEKLELRLRRDIVDDITVNEVNDKASEWLKGDDFDIVLLAPHGQEKDLLSGLTLKKYINQAKRSDPGSYKLNTVKGYSLVETQLKPMKITSSKIDSVGVTEIVLDNGIRIVLKSSSDSEGSEKDRILLRGFAIGGAAMYTGEDYFSAVASPKFVARSGLGVLTADELSSFFEKKRMNVVPYVEDFESGVIGQSNVQDFEYLMDVVYRYFVSPKKDEKSFRDWKYNERRMALVGGAEMYFRDSINRIARDSEMRCDSRMLERVNFDRSYDIFKERFSNVGNFTFVIVGDFNLERVIPTVVKYLGSIPRSKSTDRSLYDSSSYKIRPSNVKIKMSGPIEGAFVEMRLFGKINFTKDNLNFLDASRWLIEARMVRRLRDIEKGVYGVGVDIKCFEYPYRRFTLSIGFRCAAADVERLIRSAKEEMVSIAEYGVEDDLLDNYTTMLKRHVSRALSNKQWLDYLLFKYGDGFPVFYPKAVIGNAERISGKDISIFFRKYFDANEMSVFSLTSDVISN